MICIKKTVIILGILFCCILSAKVFTSIRSANAPFESLQNYDGVAVYSAGANINDSKAELRIFAFSKSFKETVRILELLFGDIFGRGGSFGKAVVRGNKFVTRLVVINLGSLDQTLVFAIRQTKDEYAKSQLPLTRHVLSFVPEYPGSIPVSYLANDETSFAMGTSEIYATPQTVQMFYVNALESQGWIPGITLKQGERLPKYMTWIKPGRFCSVYANTNPKGSTTVSLIYKEFGQ